MSVTACSDVWREASPYTSSDILALDEFCRERYIELVPNQNSLGHFHRFLRHEAYSLCTSDSFACAD